MSEKEQPPIMDQKLCVNGCGFFGSSQTSHMCSKCWKDAMTKTMREADANTDGANGSSTPIAPEMKPSAEEAMDASSSSSSSPSQQPQSGADLPQQVPPPPSPVSPDMAVDPAPSTPSPTDVTVPPQPPSMTTAMEEVVDEEMASLTPTAPEPAEVPVAATVSPMAVSEEDQGAAALLDGARGGGAGGAGAAAAAAPAGPMPMIDVGVAAGAAAAMETPATRPVQKNRKRCFQCRKKVGYTAITCRCGYVFCSLHRYPEQHNCTFDFKAADRKDLEKTVVGGGQFSKIDRL